MKSPDEEIVPTLEFPPTIPFTFQLTDWFAELLTDAVNCCAEPRSALAAAGVMVTATEEPPIIVTLAEPLAVESAWLIACTETEEGCGRICGAV